ncbi:MAG: hypothetical protein E7022_11810 [Desulfovibrio desulfuricans]|jgi:hypothetical protein|nr:hypothetical protein [Desulfovibrio desulfuricans]
MPSLDMSGPYPLDNDTINTEVWKTSPGNYALGKINKDRKFVVSYVGRSDSDVNDRLHDHVDEKYTHFKFSYAASPKEAFEKECENYHDFEPRDNSIHPDRPDGCDWKCPRCSIFDE